jgi:para-nitrobenzyl esterase
MRCAIHDVERRTRQITVGATFTWLAVAAGCSSPYAGGLPARGVVVTVDSGPISGTPEGATYAFKGIPYAAPPVGNLRWRRPAGVAPWSSVRDASAFGGQCAQVTLSGQPVGSEDCLYLNVWTPQAPSASPLPVLFWIHGGGNAGGSGDLYSGAAWSQTANVVVVTINYRLGALGWFAEPAFASEDPHGAAGDYGLSDQLAALAWVQRNVAAFGGDPRRVLVFGESAGGIDSCALMTSPVAAGLFSSVISESGPCASLDAAAAAASADYFVQGVGCQNASDLPACLRAVPLSTVLAHTNGSLVFNFNGNIIGTQYMPTQDGFLLPLRPEDALEQGQLNELPWVIGTNADESGQLSFLPQPINTDADYLADLQAAFGTTRGQTLYANYPSGNYPSARAAFVAVLNDYLFDCPTRRQARAVLARHPHVWRYSYTHTLDNPPNTPPWHGFEVLPLWAAWPLFGYTPSAAEVALSKQLQAHWVALATHGAPDVSGDVMWPRYDSATDPYIALDESMTVGQGLRGLQCDFMDTFDTR